MAASLMFRALIAGAFFVAFSAALEHAKTTAAEEAGRQRAHSVKESPKESLCSAMSADCPSSLAAAPFPKMVDAADGADYDEDATAASGRIANVVDLSSVEAKESRSDALRYALQALALIVVADGLRRWKSSVTRDEAPPVAQEPSMSPADYAAARAKRKLDRLCLLKAVLEGDEPLCDEILSKGRREGGVNIDARDVWGCTALHAAAVTPGPAGPRLVSALLKKGANVNALDEWDESPLHLASRKGTEEVCELLLAYGARLSLANMSNCTPLLVAGKENRQEMCRFLLGRGATVGDAVEIPSVLEELMGVAPDEPVFDDDAFGFLSNDAEDELVGDRLSASCAT